MSRIWIESTLLLLAAAALPAQTASPLFDDARAAWHQIGVNLAAAAERMPEAGYAFRPTPEVRTFGEIIGHLADANTLFCSPLHGTARAPGGAEKKLQTKAELTRALNDSITYCSEAIWRHADAAAATPVPLFGRPLPQLAILSRQIAHANEHYGNLVTYLRMKNLVPPSSEPRRRVYFDQGHGESPLPPAMTVLAARQGLAIAAGAGPLTAKALEGVRLLYLRAPSAAIAAEEAAAVQAFVRGGGSLLVVVDEERRQSLATTGVNAVIEPFGLGLTPDTPYLHNCGAIAPAGPIHAAAREIPYSGGRAVTGGTPFAYQLTAEGKPGLPFAAWQQVAGGGRIIVMGEGMASLFLGDPAGQRLTGVPRDPRATTYWGKDSAIFMDEVFAWLLPAR